MIIAKKRKMLNRGFTLVELIIVIAIMAVLAGLITPSVIRYIRKARAARATEEARVIISAVESAIASNEGADAPLLTDKTFITSDGDTIACGVLTNWMLGRTQNGTIVDDTDADYADYLCAKEVLENLMSDASLSYKFFKFNGSANRPIGMNCNNFYATYGCPGVIVVYNKTGKVIFMEYYNYDCLIRFEDNEYTLMDSETFVDATKLQY